MSQKIGVLIIMLLTFTLGWWMGAEHRDKPVPPRKPLTTLNGGTITSTVAYPEQGRYYVRVRGDNGVVETWEVSKGFFDKVILGAPINRRDNTNG